ncbi:MAG: hypothetical protein R6X25_03815 [Candidatus Krumholzibacteriia bacterium]
MKWTLKTSLLLTAALGMIALGACDDDDDGNGIVTPPVEAQIVGTWLSAGDDVAPLLVAVFNIDSVRVTFFDNNTVRLEQHTENGAWTTNTGIYTVQDVADNPIDEFVASYSNPSFTQEGIIRIFEASPDSMWLEVVQTEPNIGAMVPTPDGGFGADPALGNSNIQVYRRISDEGTPPPDIQVLGTWLSAGDDVAPLLVTVFDIDSVRVTFNANQTLTLEQHIEGGAWTTNTGTYAVTDTPNNPIDEFEASYSNPSFTQEGIIRIFEASPDSMWLEVVQTEPNIGAMVPTPDGGFGADPALGNSNIQVYRRVE